MIIRKLLLLAVPLMVIIYSLSLRNSLGPFYYNTGYDPSYVYLINSLNIVQLKSPQHVDHPGTPVQLTGAVILKLVYFFTGNSDDISKDVLGDPEKYLKVIYLVYLIFNTAVMFFCGAAIYKKYGSVLTAVLIQLSVFSSFTTSIELTSVTSEIFLIPLTMMLITFSFLYAGNGNNSKSNYILIFALICGIAVATKLSFLPMVLIPFLLIKGAIRKVIFTILTAAVFAVSILPAISNYDYFSGWITGLITHEGVYGSGEKKIINPDSFIENLLSVFQSEIAFTVSVILMAATILLIILRYKSSLREKIIRDKFNLLLSFFLACCFQLIIVAKHYSPRYMLPALMLSVPAIYLGTGLLSEILNSKFPRIKLLQAKFIPVFLIIITLSMTIVQFYKRYIQYNEYRNQIDHMNEIIENYPSGKIVVSSYGTSREEYALVFALYYSGEMNSKYKSIILEKYPDKLYFDYFNKILFSLEPEYEPGIFKSCKLILFLNVFPQTNQDFMNDLRESYSAEVIDFRILYSTSSGETLYKVMVK